MLELTKIASKVTTGRSFTSNIRCCDLTPFLPAVTYARCDNGKRFIVSAAEKLTAFLELRSHARIVTLLIASGNADALSVAVAVMRARFAPLFFVSAVFRPGMGSALFALFPRVIRLPVMGSVPFTLFSGVIRAPVFGRTYSGAPTLFHADLDGSLRKLEGEVPKYFARRGESFAS